MIDPNDLFGQLTDLRKMIADLESVASEPYAVRTLERARRRERELADRLARVGVRAEAA